MKTAQIADMYDYACKQSAGTNIIVRNDDDGVQLYRANGMRHDLLSIINQPFGGGYIACDAMETYHLPSKRIKRFRSETSVKRSIRRFIAK